MIFHCSSFSQFSREITRVNDSYNFFLLLISFIEIPPSNWRRKKKGKKGKGKKSGNLKIISKIVKIIYVNVNLVM